MWVTLGHSPDRSCSHRHMLSCLLFSFNKQTRHFILGLCFHFCSTVCHLFCTISHVYVMLSTIASEWTKRMCSTLTDYLLSAILYHNCSGQVQDIFILTLCAPMCNHCMWSLVSDQQFSITSWTAPPLAAHSVQHPLLQIIPCYHNLIIPQISYK